MSINFKYFLKIRKLRLYVPIPIPLNKIWIPKQKNLYILAIVCALLIDAFVPTFGLKHFTQQYIGLIINLVVLQNQPQNLPVIQWYSAPMAYTKLYTDLQQGLVYQRRQPTVVPTSAPLNEIAPNPPANAAIVSIIH